MKHMSTIQLIAMMGDALSELKHRFDMSDDVDDAKAVVEEEEDEEEEEVHELSLLQDTNSKQYFYSVCGYPAQCPCRYPIVPKTRNAERDMKQRPKMDECALYLWGLDHKTLNGRDSQTKLQTLLTSNGCAAATVIKVIRNYAFLTFANHADAAAAQRTLSAVKGYSVIFNRCRSQGGDAEEKK